MYLDHVKEDSQNEKLAFYGGQHILPERNYYFDKKFEVQRTALWNHLQKIYKLVKKEGISLEEDFVKKVYEFDALIAKYSMTGAQRRLYDEYYTKTNLSDFYEKINDLKFLQKKLDNYSSANKSHKLSKTEKDNIKDFMEKWYKSLNIRTILTDNYKKNYKNWSECRRQVITRSHKSLVF